MRREKWRKREERQEGRWMRRKRPIRRDERQEGEMDE